VKSVAVMGDKGFVLALVRGDHAVHEIKLAKLPDLSEFRMATEAEILEHLGTEPGFIGPIAAKKPITVIADRTVAAMSDFVVGANEKGFHIAGVNWGRDLPEPALVADIRSIVEGDPSPDGQGTLSIARGIEVGHVFNLGKKYAEAMKATVLDAEGKAQVMHMGCYGIGVSRIVAAAIEQNSDANGIIWPEPMAPWRVAVCILNPKNAPEVVAAAEALYDKLLGLGIEACLDDRGLRPGPMLADIELIGIPHRVVVSERGLANNTYEYRGRRETENSNLTESELLAKFS
jgi:prolyl-tRNA synthetase